MSSFYKTIASICVFIVTVLLANCSAMSTALNHHNLEVSTKMSESIFLDPVPNSQKTVYVQINNTSNQQNLGLRSLIVRKIRSKGYRVVSDMSRAHFIVQANVLKIGKMDRQRADDMLAGGYGGAISGAVIGGVAGAMTGHRDAPIGGALAGAAVGMIADAMVKDVNYTMITDIQLSQRLGNSHSMLRKTKSRLNQGTSGSETLTSTDRISWKKYRTRVISSARKMNLKFIQAKKVLVNQLAGSIAGLL